MGTLGQGTGQDPEASTADDTMEQDQTSQASGGTGIGHPVMRQGREIFSRRENMHQISLSTAPC